MRLPPDHPADQRDDALDVHNSHLEEEAKEPAPRTVVCPLSSALSMDLHARWNEGIVCLSIFVAFIGSYACISLYEQYR